MTMGGHSVSTWRQNLWCAAPVQNMEASMDWTVEREAIRYWKSSFGLKPLLSDLSVPFFFWQCNSFALLFSCNGRRFHKNSPVVNLLWGHYVKSFMLNDLSHRMQHAQHNLSIQISGGLWSIDLSRRATFLTLAGVHVVKMIRLILHVTSNTIWRLCHNQTAHHLSGCKLKKIWYYKYLRRTWRKKQKQTSHYLILTHFTLICFFFCF